MRKFVILLLLGLSACMSTPYRNVKAPFASVKDFDAQKYLGKWYEIARYPSWYEAGCVNSTAEYSLISPSEIRVQNSCRQETAEGTLSVAKGSARIEAPGILTVKFFGGYPKAPNYYVMAIKGDYEVAVIGQPNGTSAWILARTSQISDEDYAWGLGVLKSAGYETQKLYKTPQFE